MLTLVCWGASGLRHRTRRARTAGGATTRYPATTRPWRRRRASESVRGTFLRGLGHSFLGATEVNGPRWESQPPMPSITYAVESLACDTLTRTASSKSVPYNHGRFHGERCSAYGLHRAFTAALRYGLSCRAPTVMGALPDQGVY